MSGDTVIYDSLELDSPPEAIIWRSWPLGDKPLGGSIVLVALAVAGAGVQWVTGRTHFALLAMAVLSITLWRFFLPVTFELNADGVSQWLFSRHKQISWQTIYRYEICTNGVLLLPFADRCPMDSFRGLYLPWGDHRAEVLAHVHHYLHVQEA